jgi:anthranilate synthase component 1
MHIERYSHVMHIVSNVQGALASRCTSFDAFRSIFPAGTVSGAPKVRAIELVAGLEPSRRGVYAGCVGVFGYDGAIDTAIAAEIAVAAIATTWVDSCFRTHATFRLPLWALW